jgi:hypothetical protein
MSLPVTTFAFSRFSVWYTFAFLLIAITISLAIPINENNISLGPTIASLGLLGYFIYFLKIIFIPTISDKRALTLNEDTIYIQKTNETIYWKDVTKISLRYFGRSSFFVFELVEEKTDVRFYTSFFSADDAVIEKVLQDYFRQILIADGQLWKINALLK